MIIKYLLKNIYFRYSFIKRLSAILNLKISSYNLNFRNMNAKPPNILVYTGDSCPKLFKEIYNNLQKCLRDDRYTIYHLLESEINEQPWMENSVLLIISGDMIKNNTAKAFETFLKDFGNILLICSKFNDSFCGNKCFQISDNETLTSFNFKNVGDVILYRGKYSYDTCGTVLCYDTSQKPLIHKVFSNKNILLCSEIYLDRDFLFSTLPSNYKSDNRFSILKYILSTELGLEIKSDHMMPRLTPGNYVNKNEFENMKLLSKEDHFNPSEIPLFRECKINYLDELIKVPVYFYKHLAHPPTFNINVYYSKLYSKVYGHHLVYFPVITSTMDVAEQFSEYEGIVIIAGSQISGKGRRSNKWISPAGCAMFTLLFNVPLSSRLGKRMSLLQHISALAVVHSIRSQTAYKDLKLQIKWPNDIYCNGVKLGGLIATSVVQKDVAHVYVGWGINVENSYPTTCLNDIIDKYNTENSLSLPHLCIEEVVAHTVTQMEYFVKDFIDQGPEKFFIFYYSYWMHGDQVVTLKNLNEQGTIIGLDDFGFLKVKTNKGEILTLQPDGNRFDIMKNLIYST